MHPSADLFDPDNLELGLLQLTEEQWNSISTPSIVKNSDDTYTTGNDFFDSFEEQLAEGADINDLLAKFNT